MKELVFHSLKMRKVATISVVCSVALSVMVFFALGLTYGGVQAGVQTSLARGGADLVVVPSSAADELSDTSLLFTGAPAAIYFDKSVYERICQADGVEKATPQFYSQSLNQPCCSTDGMTRVIGVDFSTDWTVQPFTNYDLSSGIADDELVVGSGAAGTVGEEMQLLGKTFKVVDRLQASGTDLDSSMLLNIDTARMLSESAQGLQYLWQKNGSPDNLLSSVLIKKTDNADVTRLITTIENSADVKVIQRSNVVENSQEQLQSVFSILLICGVAMLLITLIQLFARFYSCVWERKSELALYRAIGACTKQIKRLIAAEVGIITVLGLVCGFVLGAGFYMVLLSILQNSSSFPFIGLSPILIAALILALAVLFAILALISIAAPLRQIARLDPSLAMQQGDIG